MGVRSAIGRAVGWGGMGLLLSLLLLTTGCGKQAEAGVSDAQAPRGVQAAPQSVMPDDPKQREIAERFKAQSEAQAQKSRENAARAGVGKH